MQKKDLNNKERIFGLDVMRAVAILTVLFAHTVFLLPFSPGTQYSFLRFFGFIGVEIFFVLSGYLIGKILIRLYSKHGVNARATFYFWMRRWFRTLPNYYLALIVSVGLFWFSTKTFVFSEPSYLRYFVFSQNLYSIHPDFFILAWSLCVEEWFYLLLPLSFIAARFILKNNKGYFLVAIVSFVLIELLIRILVVNFYELDWESQIRRVVVFRLDSIMIGVLAAYLHLNYEKMWLKLRVSTLCLGIFLILGLCVLHFRYVLSGALKANFFHETFFFSLLSLSISFFLPILSSWKIQNERYITKATVFISRISYSLYLFHLVIMWFVLTILNKVLSNGNIVKFAASWICCILLSSLIYYKFELPVMNKRDRYKL